MTGDGTPPWPGRLPAPAPAAVVTEPVAVEVVDADGAPVGVDGRGLATGAPARLRVASRWVEVVAWAGPWPVEERWWDPAAARRRARLQVVDADGVARLVALEAGRWWLLAVYD
jgi:protein ImuB